MAWLKTDDSAATEPRVLALADGVELRRLAAWGFLSLVCSLAANHMTDDVLTEAQCRFVAPTTWQRQIDACVRAGLVTKVPRQKAWKLVKPSPLHMRSREEILNDRVRASDRRDDFLRAYVIRRDGDACRWCGRSVNTSRFDTRSPRGREFDHLDITQPTTIATYVVSCRGCNRRRAVPSEAATMTLLPAPLQPLYGEQTVSDLREFFPGDTFVVGRNPAPRDLAPGETTRSDTSDLDPALRATQTPLEAPQTVDADRRPTVGSRSDARDGTGRVGTGQVGSGAAPPPTQAQIPARRRRARRGRNRSSS
ncbi:HNH endonuclease [Angustibacter luteus]|uniref:HNH endonuclease n=1 Tax=Angustibacter luteus TaxID=658456 RepID=A0ABW1JK51_9ACTN